MRTRTIKTVNQVFYFYTKQTPLEGGGGDDEHENATENKSQQAFFRQQRKKLLLRTFAVPDMSYFSIVKSSRVQHISPCLFKHH